MHPLTTTTPRTMLRVGLAVSAAVASIAALTAPVHAAGATSTAKSGFTLVVTAAAGTANDITLVRSGGFFEVTDVVGFTAGPGCQSTRPRFVQCSAAGISEIRISAGDGHDKVHLDTSTFTRVLGGTGNDTLTSIHFSGSNRLSGNDGNDTITGAQFDSLFGQNDNDTLRGGEFQNGGAGADQLFGSNDNDTLDGGPGFDRINGFGGTDRCVNGEEIQNCEL